MDKTTMHLERHQVLAYRMAAQGLHRDMDDVTDLAVLDLGVQDTPPGSSAQALGVRLGEAPPGPGTDERLATTWSTRGAPHVHRADELPDLARALWPVSDDDALVRLDTSSSPVRASGMPAREALRLVAEHVADIVSEPMPKGEVSTALTPRVPDEMTVDCLQCEATHIVETLFRSAVLPAGIVFQPGTRTVTFTRLPGWPGVPAASAGADRLVRAYLRVHGPATDTDAAAFFGTRAKELSEAWPDDLAAVGVDGRTAWALPHTLDAMREPPSPPRVRLLPPSDPFLQARDREFLVPTEEHRKALWPILGRPGALLANAEVAGTWRARKQGRRLRVTVQPFRSLSSAVKRDLDDEAQLIATSRGATSAEVTVE